jgi:hypothetical protein
LAYRSRAIILVSLLSLSADTVSLPFQSAHVKAPPVALKSDTVAAKPRIIK